MCTRGIFLGAAAGLVSLAGPAYARTGDPGELELAVPAMRRIADGIWLGRLSPNVWVHTSTHDLGHGDAHDFYPANGAIVFSKAEALLIDTSWTNPQTETILREWERMRMPRIGRALVTHFHRDRLGGIDVLRERGIPVFGNPLTIGLALDNGSAAPRPLHDLEKSPQRLGALEVFYPGAGHTLDNIVVWIPADRVLFGGCLIKATTAPDLGYLGDAHVDAWPATVRRVAQRYAPRHVIPGHGTIAGNAIAHTLALADAANRPA